MLMMKVVYIALVVCSCTAVVDSLVDFSGNPQKLEMPFLPHSADNVPSPARMMRTNIIRSSAYKSYTLSTLVGGIGSTYGDYGLAKYATLYEPTDVAIDTSWNVYIADTDNHVIRKVSYASGIITTVAGRKVSGYLGDGGPATSAYLKYPEGVKVDDIWNIYIADTGNNQIRKVSSATGIITTLAGWNAGFSGDGGPSVSASVTAPRNVALDRSRNLYIADTGNHAIRKITAATGIITTVAGRGGSFGYSGDGGRATNAYLNTPSSLVVDGVGNLYIADTYNSAIRKVSSTTGLITTIILGTYYLQPVGIGLDLSGNVVFTDYTYGYIYIAEAANNFLTDTSLGIFNAQGIAIDSAGNIYFADWGNDLVKKVTCELNYSRPDDCFNQMKKLIAKSPQERHISYFYLIYYLMQLTQSLCPLTSPLLSPLPPQPRGPLTSPLLSPLPPRPRGPLASPLLSPLPPQPRGPLTSPLLSPLPPRPRGPLTSPLLSPSPTPLPYPLSYPLPSRQCHRH
jgi:hypothetical protein